MSIEYGREMSAGRRVARREDERTVAGAHRPMRRADREVVYPGAIEAIVDSCDIVDVAYADAEGLTVVPLNFGYDYDRGSGRLVLWFHSAPHGRKLDAIRASGNRLTVAFAMRTGCEATEGRTACNWGETFASIVGEGTASTVDDLDDCRHGLVRLMAQQAHMPHVEFTDAQVRSVTVWRIESSRLTAKTRPRPTPAHTGRHTERDAGRNAARHDGREGR